MQVSVGDSESRLEALMTEVRTEMDQSILNAVASGTKKLQVEMREAIPEGMRTLKKEIAAALHISGKYDMELKADIARTRGYSRTLGEHIWKTERNIKSEMDEVKNRLELLQSACDEVTYL